MSVHMITRRYRDARPTGTVHGAECSCGELLTGASPQARDLTVRRHLGLADTEETQR